jgi:general control protein GCN4
MFNLSEFTPTSDGHDDDLDESLNIFTNHFEAINEQAPGQASTVSPTEIMVDSMSAPPSGAFTEMTTPGTSTWESPYTANSCETSPLFMDNLSPDDDPDKWPSLFGEIQEPEREVLVSNTITSPTTSHVAPKMSRNDSSPGQTSSRSSHQGRHSFTAGVAPRRRDKPLPAITVEDPSDTIAVKRARNTLAARKSREKRMERTEALVSQVNDLEAEVERWKGIALGMGHRE